MHHSLFCHPAAIDFCEHSGRLGKAWESRGYHCEPPETSDEFLFWLVLCPHSDSSPCFVRRSITHTVRNWQYTLGLWQHAQSLHI